MGAGVAIRLRPASADEIFDIISVSPIPTTRGSSDMWANQLCPADSSGPGSNIGAVNLSGATACSIYCLSATKRIMFRIVCNETCAVQRALSCRFNHDRRRLVHENCLQHGSL